MVVDGRRRRAVTLNDEYIGNANGKGGEIKMMADFSRALELGREKPVSREKEKMNGHAKIYTMKFTSSLFGTSFFPSR